jgi:two-component system cell cycle sensor histidine kinase PleC
MQGAIGSSKSNSLMSEYSALLGDAVLRHRTRIAEQSARVEAELASRIKSEFIANMSHELRTPLNTVLGFSKLLCEFEHRRLPDSEVVQYAHLIRDAASHLLAVINDILDISKIQSGRYSIEAREVNLEEILQACVASFQQMARDAKLTLHYRLDSGFPLVRGDGVKLRQIFTNLISNAIKFTRAEGQVSVEGSRLSDGGVRIIVRDTGIGMSEDEIRVALTPFGQVDGGKSRWREGTGLGLPIAKALIELHGGRIEVRSAKSMGTEVAVLLPSRHKVTSTPSREQRTMSAR